MKILTFNAGSSTYKSCLYEITEGIPQEAPAPIWEAKVDWSHHQGTAEIQVKTATGGNLEEQISADSHSAIITHLLDTLCQGSTQVIQELGEIDVVGHRVVHGGRKYSESIKITAEVKNAIAHLSNIAPVHNPVNLEGIEVMEQHLDVPQIAVFDTAFHSHIPDAAAIYPGAYEWIQQDIRRYGFHGISYQYCTQRAAQILDQDINSLRIITCHLGNGCSLVAIKNGRSIDTTMGFTPLDGLMMGSRSGAIDPGILIHLLRQGNYTVEELDHLLNRDSGLKGISGISGDMRQIYHEIAQGNNRAKLAFDIYIHRLKSCIGSMIASLGGLDVLIFTGGVGENSAEVRSQVSDAFSFLGVEIDRQKNQQKPVDINISMPTSKVRLLVIHTQEDWQIACECWQCLN
ncbi:acetate/propionate family kinase [Calothrix sp. PCC 6303]|uniref:acetate/propionate family kinase n=1 Tax=Calothrix sp. PCC 6303 TaxID=1170562 RepID=UPI0002A05A05|nr:acetate kinase [Calothrix sp. PCC 6303]AFY99161.1 acetate kinase [Calothrix sp. PCC 6303]